MWKWNSLQVCKLRDLPQVCSFMLPNHHPFCIFTPLLFWPFVTRPLSSMADSSTNSKKSQASCAGVSVKHQSTSRNTLPRRLGACLCSFKNRNIWCYTHIPIKAFPADMVQARYQISAHIYKETTKEQKIERKKGEKRKEKYIRRIWKQMKRQSSSSY